MSEDREDRGGYFRLLERIVLVYGLLLAIAVGLGVFAWSRLHDVPLVGGDESSAASLLAPPLPPPVPSLRVEGATARAWFGHEGGLTEGVVWALGVRGHSSQYTPTKWSAHRATGRPDVFPELADHPEAWAPLGKDAGIEWITLTWPAGNVALALTIAENFNPGAIVRVDDVSDAASPTTLWASSEPPLVGAGSLLRIDLPAAREVRALRVVLDTRRVAGWNEIDAVGLVTEKLAEATVPPPMPAARDFPSAQGFVDGATVRALDRLPSGVRWATSVMNYSTAYSQGAWSPDKTLGPADVWPNFGDDNRAWATKRRNDGPEWISVRVPDGLVSSIVIVETYNPGTVVRVDALELDERAVTLWEGTSPVTGDRQVLRVDLLQPRQLDKLRVVMDTRVVKGWNEIDAIGVLSP